MTHNFKTGVTYKTRGGGRAWFIQNDSLGGMMPSLLFAHEDGVQHHGVDGSHLSASEETLWDIIDPWEESLEEIDVANMWVVVLINRQKNLLAIDCIFPEKPESWDESHVAIIRVSEWEAIKRGERKLIKGEGL